jgi:hypothetical protein
MYVRTCNIQYVPATSKTNRFPKLVPPFPEPLVGIKDCDEGPGEDRQNSAPSITIG